LSLEQFVRDRIHEDLLIARRSVAVAGAVANRGTAGSADRAQAVIEALDRRELLGLASSLERDGRAALAADIRRALAALYATHPDVRPEWLPTG
jgi:hypothetical protein